MQSRCATNCAMAPLSSSSVYGICYLGPEITPRGVLAELTPDDIAGACGEQYDKQLLHEFLLGSLCRSVEWG